MSAVFGRIDYREPGAERADLGAMAVRLAHRAGIEEASSPQKVKDAMDSAVFSRGALGALRSLSDAETPHAAVEPGSAALVLSGSFFSQADDARPEGPAFGGRAPASALFSALYPLREDKRGAARVLRRVSGHFAGAFYDEASGELLLFRDVLGAEPLYWAATQRGIAFASEIRALLALREVRERTRVNLRAVDQLMTWPGPVAPDTFFTGIEAVPAGFMLVFNPKNFQAGSGPERVVFDDFDYPLLKDRRPFGANDDPRPWIEELERLFTRAVGRRLQGNPAFLSSGGIDSALVNTVAKALGANDMHTFSIGFADRAMDERPRQRSVTEAVGSVHHERVVDTKDVYARLPDVVRLGEAPLKESYNGCALMLAEMVRAEGFTSVLSGEGSDELFAGYAGYLLNSEPPEEEAEDPLEQAEEARMRRRLWGDPTFFYEREYAAHERIRRDLYSPDVAERFERFSATARPPVNLAMLRGRHRLNQRTYLDAKLRVADHELTDHGDRVLMSQGITGRYPFLDKDVLEFSARIPPELLIYDEREKYPVRAMGAKYVPKAILNRRKFSFVAAGTPDLLKLRLDWVEELLSRENIRRAGYFDADAVENLKKLYLRPGFRINQTYEEDFLMIVLSFHLWLRIFEMPDFS